LRVSGPLATSLLIAACNFEPEPLGAAPTTTDADEMESSSGADDWTRAGDGAPIPTPQPDVGSEDETCTVSPGTCPPGFKCLPSRDPMSDERRCTPIVEDPGTVGEPCYVAEDPADGDSCGIQSVCWNVDDATRIGYCVSFCHWCELWESCIEVGMFGLCFDRCHPLVQDCPLGQGCYPDAGTFVCAPDFSGDLGAVGDPCNAVYACDRGNACVVPTLTPGCEGNYCCSALCEVGDTSPCLPGQECLPVPLEGPNNAGVCGIP